MSDTGSDDPSEGAGENNFCSERARKLFGHKGGAKPWDNPDPAETDPQPQPGATDTSSAPYPQSSTYSSQPEPVPAEAPPPAPSGGGVDDDGELTLLHPNYKLLMRVSAIIFSLVLMLVAIPFDFGLQEEVRTPPGLIMGPALIVALFLSIRVPTARYNARGFQMGSDRLRVVRGVLWHSDTIVPFGRVQHIDVDQGPIERALDIATMTLHTAGSHNASVRLPGLGHQLATEMREEIRAHIKRESL